MSAHTLNPTVAWWREPTKDQWYAFTAAWLGWTLDAFDFTVFLFIIGPIAKEFNSSTALVALVGTATLFMRLGGAVAAGWMADRMGRRAPLMISILWYSICNFIAGFSPTFIFLLVVRAVLGIGMGAEWPAGAALANESWPVRSRGLMSAVLQGSWALGYALSALLYWAFFESIGWRGMLWLGIIPALAVVWIRLYVKEPEVWVENQRQQKETNKQMKVPLAALFRKDLIWTTLSVTWWLISAYWVYYSLFFLLVLYLTTVQHMTAAEIGPAMIGTNLVTFAFSFVWGGLTDKIGRRWAMIIPAFLGMFVTPVYLLSSDHTIIALGIIIQGAFAGCIYGINPSYANERFPTEVRATGAGFCVHVGSCAGGLVGPVLLYFASVYQTTLAMPLLISTLIGLVSFIVTLMFSPETKGKELKAELTLH